MVTIKIVVRSPTTTPRNTAPTPALRPITTITQVLYADGSVDQYTYDSGINAVGRLSQLTSLDSNMVATATVQYDYNGFGEITQKRERVDGKTFVNQYQYNALGAISQLTYPSGTQVAYTYNGGNIDSVSINGQVFLSQVTYEPFGGVRSWQAANGDVQQRLYDSSGRLTQITQGSFSKSFSYDANHNITAMGDGTNTSNNTNYGYDALNRLTDYSVSTQSIAYIYDPNGNRTQQTVNSSGITDTTDYNIDSTSNRLLDIINAASSTTRTILYDANGNTIDNGTHSFQYDSRNRLLTVDNGDKATYQYNALSQRIRKEVKGNPADVNGDGIINHLDITATNGQNAVAVDCNSDGNPSNTDNGNGKSQGNGNAKGQDTSCIAKQIGNNPNSPNTQTGNGGSGGSAGNKVSYFVYDEAGQLLAEHDDMGAPVSETVYLYTIPVAVIRQGVVYTVHTDQLDTPRAISDPQGITVWRWEGEPFGATLADEDPDGDGVQFVFNGRFAGQHYDSETGLYYNYYRYYGPATGRYVTSDPMGLLGGLNTYGYVFANSLKFTDPYGLLEINDTLKNIFNDPRVRGALSFGASLLAEYAAENMCPGTARGIVNLIATGFAIESATQFTLYAVGMYTVAFATVETGVGPIAAVTAGTVSAGIAVYDVNMASTYLQRAVEDFQGKENSNKDSCKSACEF